MAVNTGLTEETLSVLVEFLDDCAHGPVGAMTETSWQQYEKQTRRTAEELLKAMGAEALTFAQNERQDMVDNAILDLCIHLSYGRAVVWDIGLLGKIRDVVQKVLCDDLKLLAEMEFYPHLT